MFLKEWKSHNSCARGLKSKFVIKKRYLGCVLSTEAQCIQIQKHSNSTVPELSPTFMSFISLKPTGTLIFFASVFWVILGELKEY